MDTTIAFIRGDNHRAVFEISDYEGEIKKAWLTVKNENGEVLIKKNTKNGGIIKEGNAYIVLFDPNDTDGFNTKIEMEYDFQVLIDGEKYTVQIGKFKLTKDITTPDCEV